MVYLSLSPNNAVCHIPLYFKLAGTQSCSDTREKTFTGPVIPEVITASLSVSILVLGGYDQRRQAALKTKWRKKPYLLMKGE